MSQPEPLQTEIGPEREAAAAETLAAIKSETSQPEPPQTEIDHEHEAAAAEALVALAAGKCQDELAREVDELARKVDEMAGKVDELTGKVEELASKVAMEAAERSSIILFNWVALRHILDRHEAALRKKWTKKSKDWRKTILSTAWPNMPLSHRPDLVHLVKAEIRFQKDGVRMEAPMLDYTWPYLNMEDLTRDKPILCLLNSRGRNPPAMFADSELSFCRLGLDYEVIVPLKLDGFTMQLEGEDVESYGKLVPIGVDNTLKAGYAPGDGLLILEIQQSLMQFLVKCCELSLDKPIDILMNEGLIDRQLGPARISSNSKWPTLGTMNDSAPYFPPATLDFRRLQKFLDARHLIAQHHIWALREDPGYFSSTLRQWADHQPEGIRDSASGIHGNYHTPSFWNEVIHDVIIDAYRSVIFFDILRKQVRVLIGLEWTHTHAIDPVKPLPREYWEQIQLFRIMLFDCTKQALMGVKLLLPASPPLHNLWVRDRQNGEMVLLTRDGYGPDVEVEHDPIVWIYHKLQNATKAYFYGTKELIDEMDRLVFTQPKQKERVSPLLGTVIADVGLLAQVRHEIDSYYPWAPEFRHEANSPVLHGVAKSRLSEVFEMCPFVRRLDLRRVFQDDGKFLYPSDRRKSSNNAQAMRKAEQILDEFWQEADRQYEKFSGRGLDKIFLDRFTVKIELERLPECVETSEEMSDQDNSKPTVELGNRALRVTKALFYKPSALDGPEKIAWEDFLYFMDLMKFEAVKLHATLWHFSKPFAKNIQFYEPLPESKIKLRLAMQMGRQLMRTYGWHPEMFGLHKCDPPSMSALESLGTGL